MKHSTAVIQCLVCNKNVSSRKMIEHLLYGYVRCALCKWNTFRCTEFNKTYRNDRLKSKCSHSELDWRPPNCLQNINSYYESVNSQIIPYLKKYLKDTVNLRVDPWHTAYIMLNRYIDAMEKYKGFETSGDFNSQLYASNINEDDWSLELSSGSYGPLPFHQINLIDKPSLTRVKVPQSQPPPPSQQQQPSLSNNNSEETKTRRRASLRHKKPRIKLLGARHLHKPLVLPKDGHYLVSTKIFNDCPECYAVLDERNLIFNRVNGLISVACSKCSLLIYFITSPDGKEPLVKLIAS